MTKAPKKLSTAIKMAITDQLKAEKDKELHINMEFYHRPDYNKAVRHCEVCFAGAVMHYRHGLTASMHVLDVSYTDDWLRAFKALDQARRGSLCLALACMRLPVKGIKTQPVTPYEENPVKFRQDMRATVKYLESKNL